MKKRVAILKGGDSVEREVSLSTGQSCSKALIRLGYNVKSIDTKENFIGERLLIAHVFRHQEVRRST